MCPGLQPRTQSGRTNVAGKQLVYAKQTIIAPQVKLEDQPLQAKTVRRKDIGTLAKHLRRRLETLVIVNTMGWNSSLEGERFDWLAALRASVEGWKRSSAMNRTGSLPPQNRRR